MAKHIKKLAAWFNFSSFSRTYMIEGQNQLLQMVLWPYTPPNRHTNKQMYKRIQADCMLSDTGGFVAPNIWTVDSELLPLLCSQ